MPRHIAGKAQSNNDHFMYRHDHFMNTLHSAILEKPPESPGPSHPG